MRIAVVAIGRLARGPEVELTRDWLARADAQGRRLGLGPVELLEVEPKKAGKTPEGEALLTAAGADACLVACDERGDSLPSRGFAEMIATLRDQGERRLCFLIGGADGLSEAVRGAARRSIAFGVQTWPHALARAMLAEQIYRAVTILSSSPYHRD